MKIKGVIEDLKIKNIKMIIIKIYLGISLELLWAVWCLQYQVVPCSGLYLFSGSIGVPQISPVLNAGF